VVPPFARLLCFCADMTLFSAMGTPHKIVDTNVLMEITAVHDLNEAAASGNASRVELRRKKARASLSLAWHFHRRARRTVSVHDEIAAQLLTKVSPDGEITQATAVSFIASQYLLPHILPGWSFCSYTDFPTGLAGPGVDDELVRRAKAAGVPIITNERISARANAKDRKKIPWKCKRDGVECYSPTAFLESDGVDIQRAAFELLAAFEKKWPEARRRDPDLGGSQMQAAFEFTRRVYRWVLK
jgi:hypothetical protein